MLKFMFKMVNCVIMYDVTLELTQIPVFVYPEDTSLCVKT